MKSKTREELRAELDELVRKENELMMVIVRAQGEYDLLSKKIMALCRSLALNKSIDIDK